MSSLIVYLELEWKRSLKVLGRSAVSLLMIFGIAVGGVFGISYLLFHSQIFDPIEVAVVIPKTESESKMIAQFLAGMESVRNICRFEYMDEEHARKAVSSGEAQAAVMLPDHFYNDIYEGRPAKVTFLFPEETELHTEIFRELLSDGVSMIRTAEAGVFAAMDTAKLYETELESYEIANIISYEYIGHAFRRGEIFQESMYSPVGNMELTEFYTASMLVVFLIMTGINYGFLYKKESRAVEQKMYIDGLGFGLQMFVKIIVMAGNLWILAAAVCLAGTAAGKMAGIRGSGVDSAIFLALVPLCFGIASYFAMVYEAAGRGMQGNIILLGCNVLMIVCSGSVVPSAYLPKLIGTIGKWLPLNLFHRYSAAMLAGHVETRQLVCMAVWVAAAAGIGVLITWKRRGIYYN